MREDALVQQLIEEILESGCPAEVVCRDSPELLPKVREGWRKFRVFQSALDILFPESNFAVDHLADYSWDCKDVLPEIADYEVQAVLGRGGMGVVFRARHLRLNRLVALKMIIAGAHASPRERGRFQAEAEAVAGLRHPNIVPIYDVGESDGRPYFTMEFLEGGSLARRLAGFPQPAHQAARLLATLAGTIEVAHQCGIVHRDLKPSNILLDAEGTPKISDFGLARRLDGGPGLTLSGAVVGTPSYMSPEQARGDKSASTQAVDIYALGAILYELLTGRPPFRSESAAETVRQVIEVDPAPPSRLNAKVPRDLETICLKCLQKESTLRYASAAALSADLHRFTKGEAIVARAEGRLGRLTRRVRRRPVFSAVIATVSLSTASLAGGGHWLILERAETARRSEAQRVATELAAEEDLREMARREAESSWLAAGSALERARGRLGDLGPARLRSLLDQGTRDLQMVARLEAIRLERALIVGESWDIVHERSDEEYEEAFRRAGLGEVDDDPASMASRVGASKISTKLVASLDDWAACAKPTRQGWLLEVGRRAGKETSPWHAQARDPANWKDKATLIRLVSQAPVADLSVPLMLALETRLGESGEDSIAFLKRIRWEHPDDFWVNLRLGDVLLSKKKAEEAIGCYQSALAVRPDSAVVYNNMAHALTHLNRLEDAVVALRRASKYGQTTPIIQYNLALGLTSAGRHDEAIDQIHVALKLFPKSAPLLCSYGISLEATSHFAEAEAEFRRALAYDPKHLLSRRGIRHALFRQRRLKDLRLAWEGDIKLNPPEHVDWYGYAELCLFLGDEAEYRRAGQALFRRFADTSEAPVADRTGRARLLLPLAEAEALQALALIDRALAFQQGENPSWSRPYYLFAKALAYYRLGRLDEAMALLRGDTSKVLGPAPGLVMAMARHRKGLTVEARKTLANAVLSFDWRASRAMTREAWIYHSLRREAERLILPDLDGLLEGSHRFGDNDERFASLGACQFADRPDLVAGLYADAFSEAPQLAEDYLSGHRLNAARAASLASRGDGLAIGEAERSRWRRQARQWLRADLAIWDKALSTDPIKYRGQFRGVLTKWRDEPDLGGVRAPVEMKELSADERIACQAVWDEAKGMLDRAERVK